jgi:fatty acid desaturase
MNEKIRINWYRTNVDKPVMSDLMRKSDARAFAQVIPQLALFAVTGTLAFLAYRNINATNWVWAVPLLLAALFVHGTFSVFFGGIAGHELCHKTPFKTAFWNEFFLNVYAFLSWFDPVAYRVSHVKHHQVTVHHDHDGEVELPLGLDWHGVKFVFWQLSPVIHPMVPYNLVRKWIKIARGDLSEGSWAFTPEWTAKILPEENLKLRREHRNWARTLLIGHLLLAILFVATGNWILLLIVTFGCQYCNWLQLLCGAPQHAGMTPDVPDFRLCCRTYTCSWFPAFLYWNMQYHVEHHMFPAVPFYNLPRLRKAIEHDLPPAPHGLLATWRELIPILKRQRREPGYFFAPILPGGDFNGVRVQDDLLQAEAAQ